LKNNEKDDEELKSFGDVKNSGEEDELKNLALFFVLWWWWHWMLDPTSFFNWWSGK